MLIRLAIKIGDEPTQVLTEQAVAVARERLGELVGRVSLVELRDIDAALRLTLALD